MRVRVRLAKVGKVRFTSHRDLARVVERALRKADVPVAFTEGFSPRPKLHFGLALPTGYESLDEYLDIDLRAEPGAAMDLATLPSLLTSVLPPGMVVDLVEPVERSGDSLQQAVVACTWWVTAVGLAESAVVDAVAAMLDRSSIEVERERKGRTVTDDIRPAMERVEVHRGAPALALPEAVARAVGADRIEGSDGAVVLEMDLAAQPRAVRPSEVLAVVAPELEERRVVRLQQWTELDGARRPLAPAATRAALAEVRAS